MANTIITGTPDSGNNTIVGVVLMIIIGALVVGAVLLYQNGSIPAMSEPTKSDSTEINVTLPTPATTPTPAPAE